MPEVDDQLAVVVEFEQQVLAAPADRLERWHRRPRSPPLNFDEPWPQPVDDLATDDERLDAAAHRLDLGELGHRRRR